MLKNNKTMFKKVFALMLIYVLGISAKCQTVVTDTTVFLLNRFLKTDVCCPYPLLNYDTLYNVINSVPTAGIFNVTTYGATGNDNSVDQTAILNCINAAIASSQNPVVINFPATGTFYFRAKQTINGVPATKKIYVKLRGSVLKMIEGANDSFLDVNYAATDTTGEFILWNGTLDGNQYYVDWPGNINPTHNKPLAEGHSVLFEVEGCGNALAVGTNVTGSVVDGISFRRCRIGVFADATAKDGAALTYRETEEQGTYYKFTRGGMKCGYFLNLNCIGGAIGTHVSYQTDLPMDTETVSVHVNCNYYNQTQNAIHIEDCFKNFFYMVNSNADVLNPDIVQTIQVSNRTGLLFFDKGFLVNTRFKFNGSSGMKLCIIKNVDMLSTITDNSNRLNYLQTFVEDLNTFSNDNATNIARTSILYKCTFTGLTPQHYQATGEFFSNCKFTGFDSLGISKAVGIDSCIFVGSGAAASYVNGGFATRSSFNGSSLSRGTVPGNWPAVLNNTRIELWTERNGVLTWAGKNLIRY